MQNLKLLPIGIQTFSKIIEGNYTYVDKTQIIYNLIKQGQVYFLSRPRRFGKSLLVDTLKEIFEGNKELFKGLWIYESDYDWQKYPVVKISFGLKSIDPSIKGVLSTINHHLNLVAQEYEINLQENPDLSVRFNNLLIQLEKKYNQKVVVLIDEYDKPILDKINDIKEAEKIRDTLRNFYGVLKDSDAYLKFIFLTGVTKFSKVSLFSGLNNLEDISLNTEFGEICGITEEEIQNNFNKYLDGVDISELRQWYNGFNFLGKHKVYNPFDLLLFFKNKQYNNYWFETATPTFLIKKLKEKKYFIPDIEHITVGEEIMASFDIENIAIEALLFQTGYLTIKERKQLGSKYYYDLTYPNLEIKMSLTDSILNDFVHDNVSKSKIQGNMYLIMEKGDMDALGEEIKRIFASIPYDWFRKNNLATYEGYYSSVMYSYFCGMGLDVTAEDTTNKGRIDLTVKLENNIYIIEFKTEKTGKKPLEQIKERGYWEKYMESEKLKVKSEKLDGALLSEKLKVKSEKDTLASDSSFKKRENKENVTGDNHRNQEDRKGRLYNLQPTTCNLFLIGIEFDEQKRNITTYEWEKL